MEIQEKGGVLEVIKIVSQFLFRSIESGGISKTRLGPSAEPWLEQMATRPKRDFAGQCLHELRPFWSWPND